jgi:ribosomal-protein-alanine acetyltransferase
MTDGRVWRLRRATATDLDAVMSLENATFGGDAWSRDSMRSELIGPHGYYLVAIGEADAVDGYAGLLAPQGGEQADIQTIAVAPHARRQGLGRTLLLALMAEARRRGAAEILLEVRADNTGAEDLYRGLGFERIAVRPGYYQPDGVDAHVMRLVISEARTETT